jgi:hypothetical protein
VLPFRRGLNKTDFADSQNIGIQCHLGGRPDEQLPRSALDLVRRAAPRLPRAPQRHPPRPISIGSAVGAPVRTQPSLPPLAGHAVASLSPDGHQPCPMRSPWGLLVQQPTEFGLTVSLGPCQRGSWNKVLGKN